MVGRRREGGLTLARRVIVRTGCRLHFTLIDMNAGLGRVDGGVGVGLRRPGWNVEVSPAQGREWQVDGPAAPIVGIIRKRIHPRPLRIKVSGGIPGHVGLGSKTQLALAVASGIAAFDPKAVRLPVRALARLVGRGGTSGIGVTTFERGGLILDGGHRFSEKGGFFPSRYSKVDAPPILARFEVPRDWYFVVAIPKGRTVEGKDEVQAFKRNTPVPRDDVARLAHVILMNLMPAVVEDDVEAFGSAIDKVQSIGFKAVENRLQVPDVRRTMARMRSLGASGAGLSSFGPACYCVVRGDRAAKRMVSGLKAYLDKKGGGTAFASQAQTTGAIIRHE